MKRRSFLKATGGAVGGVAVGGMATMGADAIEPLEICDVRNGMPRRILGKTGEKVSIIGFPGLCLIHDEQEKCDEHVRKAVEKGVNYFDVAPAYGNGDAEIKMGVGLERIDRDKIFLADKTKMRDGKGAREELERSLKRLKTDHFDLYQMHCLITPEHVKEAFGPGGAMEVFLKAKEEGKVRYLGFSAHTTKSALMAMKEFNFDTVMFPINFIERFTIGFGKEVIDMAKKQETAIVAIKPMCGGRWPEGAERTRQWWYRPLEDSKEISLALRYALSQARVVAGFPPAFPDLFFKAVESVKDGFDPIQPAEVDQLRQMAQDIRSVFARHESNVAWGIDTRQPVYADSPHEPCPFAKA